MNPFLVSADWLAKHLGDHDVKVVDASWYLPAMERDARSEYEAAHVPGAVFLDQDDVVDPTSELPHTLPDDAIFAAKAGALGLKETDTIVIYDGIGLFSAPRVWWMLRLFGAKKTKLLDGGFPAWKCADHATESGPSVHYPVVFTPSMDRTQIAGLEDVRAALSTEVNIIDARPTGRFTGEEAEPRAGMRSGHMPGAVSVPAMSLAEKGRLRPADELRVIFEKAGVDFSKPSITTCGSGVTAAALTLALETIGQEQLRLYDGSWSEWGGREDTPVETGS
jgi:thiosulfate/3-mercaptopyruvate sulfurtransferase